MTDAPGESARRLQADARELGALGYVQELFRTMGGRVVLPRGATPLRRSRLELVLWRRG